MPRDPIGFPSRRALPGIALGLAAATGLLPARAQPAWPSRPLRLIVPFPTGGATDLLARVMAERLGARLGLPVVVENRGGAAGVIAAELASRAEPDGYNLFFASIGTASINANLHQRLSYRPEDLVPVALFADLPNVIVVRRDAPWHSLHALLAAARAKPGGLTYASSGSGSSLHLSGEMLKADAGVDILHVPFRGGADTANQILGGRIDIGMNNLPSVITLIRSGQLRALAVTSPERTPALPDVPTVAESGLPGYAATAWFGLQVPVHTPQPVIERLNAEVNGIVADPMARERLEQVGARMRGGSIADFAEYIRTESVKWAEVIRRSGARVD
ncbi:tripartite tricarboxylate transporter substrate binding protein [Siccirubricoccus sp. G192]|uniref:Bug family tripartite tricarboxylate transporter substrate binding protein n=1 Tax=Siccirubricoccus sp. G192 TaxID=2849651 RepID=UPI001C2B77B4|nr:tripartite tricarboxylate transporter substrate binding protein [Siccirubricoccus sp. G192]MBV1795580.1 tripartite tricarboxylate transporter substrate binding protein [Siccirubricoccus sp. G192]MBV1800257.1 tripartite tricarboxylate transporter substrate binding protein [Siccirubricoccus sp. G192]